MKNLLLLLCILPALLFACKDKDSSAPTESANAEIVALSAATIHGFTVEYATKGDANFEIKLFQTSKDNPNISDVKPVLELPAQAGDHKEVINNVVLFPGVTYTAMMAVNGVLETNSAKEITTKLADFKITYKKVDEQSFDITETPVGSGGTLMVSMDQKSFAPFTPYQVNNMKPHTGGAMYLKVVNDQQESNTIEIKADEFKKFTAINKTSSIQTDDIKEQSVELDGQNLHFTVALASGEQFDLTVKSKTADQLEKLFKSDEAAAIGTNDLEVSGTLQKDGKTYQLVADGIIVNQVGLLNSGQEIALSGIFTFYLDGNTRGAEIQYDQLIFRANK